jgi:hypothetical protein
METAEKNPKTMTQSQLVKDNTDEKNELTSNSNSNLNTLSNNNLNQKRGKPNQIEFNKLQGFDVLEKLPPKNFNDTYNQEFYGTLENLKYLSLSVPDEDKLFYHFEQNDNASISATAGQVLKSFMELFMNKMTIRKILRQCNKEFKELKVEFDNIEPSLTEEIRSEIIRMEKRLQTFLVEQKTETIRLIKEIANLQKEKDALKGEIESCYERLNNLEKEIGTNRDYNRTATEGKIGNKGLEKKTKNTNTNKNMELNHQENVLNTQENHLNTKITGNTVTNPGEGLSENFEINTIGGNNFS